MLGSLPVLAGSKFECCRRRVGHPAGPWPTYVLRVLLRSFINLFVKEINFFGVEDPKALLVATFTSPILETLTGFSAWKRGPWKSSSSFLKL